MRITPPGRSIDGLGILVLYVAASAHYGFYHLLD
jgi:hypothetical protein